MLKRTYLLLLVLPACGRPPLPADRPAESSTTTPAADTSPAPGPAGLDSILRAGPSPGLGIDTALSRDLIADAFTLRVPADASVDTGKIHPGYEVGLHIQGPSLSPAGQTTPVEAYELLVATYPNPGRASLAHFVDSLRTIVNRRIDGPDSLTYIAPGTWIRVGADSGLLIDLFCGDCRPWVVYLARDTVVAGIFATEEQGRPLDYDAQLWMAMHIADSFTWRNH